MGLLVLRSATGQPAKATLVGTGGSELLLTHNSKLTTQAADLQYDRTCQARASAASAAFAFSTFLLIIRFLRAESLSIMSTPFR